MNRITELLDLEDSDIIVSDIQVKGTLKTLTLETPPTPTVRPETSQSFGATDPKISP